MPVALLLTYSFRESSFLGVGPGPTLEQFTSVAENHSYLRIILRTLGVSLVVAAITTALAFVIAYGITFRFQGRKALAVLGVIIAAGIASFIVRIYAWGTILGTNGIINRGLLSLGVIDEPLGFLFFGYFAIIVTMIYIWLPLAVLIVYSAMQEIDPRSVEASRDLGAGRWRTLIRIVAPQARPGLLGAFVLVAILAGADFITPRLVGGTRGLTVGALIQDIALTTGDFPNAAALALVFLAVLIGSLAVIAGAWAATRRMRGALAHPLDALATRIAPRIPVRLGLVSFSRPATILLVAYLLLPTIVVVVFSFNSAASVGFPWQGFTASWYPDILGKQGMGEAIRTTGQLAVFAVLAAIALGLPVAFALARSSSRFTRFVWVCVLLPFVIPGVLLGTSLLITATDQGFELGYGVTALAHTLLVSPIVILVVYARLSAMDPALVEAARDLGSSPLRALRNITLPLILPSIVGAALLAAAYSIDEILVTTFTIGTDFTVPVWLLGQARLGYTPGINALGVMLLSATLLMFALAAAVLRRALFGAFAR